MIPGTVYRSPAIYPTAEKNPRKPQIGDYLMNAMRLFIASNEIPYLQMRLVVSESVSEEKEDGNKG